MNGVCSGGHPLSRLALVPQFTGQFGWEGAVGALQSWARAFPGSPQQAGGARRFVADLLAGSPFRDDAVVVLSELFTNAVLHSASGDPGGLVVVQVSRWRHGLRIAVTDQGSPSHPVIGGPAAQGEPAESGNGLYLAAHLATRLDWHDDASGRTIAAIFGQLPPQHHSGSQPPGPGDHPGFRGPPAQRKRDPAQPDHPHPEKERPYMSSGHFIPALAAELYAIRASVLYWRLRTGPMREESAGLRRQIACALALRSVALVLLRMLPVVAELTCLINGLLWGPELLTRPWRA